MLYVLPQAPLKNRYTEDWIQMWRRELKKLSIDYKIIGSDDLIDSTGLFGNSTTALEYEMNQIKQINDNLDDITSILILDTDFPGIFTAYATFLKWKKPSIKIYGFCHAGSWNNGDIFSGTRGKKTLELSTIETFDGIFVATEYHYKKICAYFNKSFDNLKVVGLPYYDSDIKNKVNDIPELYNRNKILISGRFEQSDSEMIMDFLNCYSYLNNYEFLTFSDIKSRQHYFEVLSQTKISISFKSEETFGLSQFEAHSLGALTLSPNNFSYTELFPTDLLYNNQKELHEKFDQFLLKMENDYFIDMKKYESSIENMINIIKN